MKLSFEDKETFLAAAGSFYFIDPPSNSNTTTTLQGVGGSSSVLSEGKDNDGTDLCPTDNVLSGDVG